MEVNNLGLIATALFVFVPTVFLIILYVQPLAAKAVRTGLALDAFRSQSSDSVKCTSSLRCILFQYGV
ncbi:MAG: photosystem II reaction center protein M [Acaryochloridaceae cyanobacterium RU_4_10]|nr:photosystem II reaction center protein M [Acaryochloridaceae cyanobacterium RU_4_10]